MAATEPRTQQTAQSDNGTYQDSVWRRTSQNRTVRLVILITGALYIVAMVYGSGMRRQVKTLQSLNEQRKVAQREYRLAQMDLRLRLAGMEQLEARRQIGLAQTNEAARPQHVAEAVRLLTEADAAQTSNADLSDVVADLKQSGASADLAQIAARMDTALDKQVPELIQTSADSDKAHPVVAPTMNDVPQLPGNDVTNTGPQ